MLLPGSETTSTSTFAYGADACLTRFHYDFAEFIADFQDSSTANELLLNHPAFTSASVVFITPDNCVEELRFKSLQAGKKVLVTSYGIRRGFWLLEPEKIPRARWEYASTLDGMEKLARSITLKEMRDEGFKVDLMVTGTGAINSDGVRFGKGHGCMPCFLLLCVCVPG